MAAGVMLASCGSEPKPEKVEVQEDGSTLSYYGNEMTTDGAITTAELLKQMPDTGSYDARITAQIVETCTKAGCWMKVDMGNEEDMMVFLGDHDWFVPTSGADGLTCYIDGTAYYDTLSVDWLQHLAEDAGKPAEEIALITEPEYQLNFHADGVIIDGYEAPAEEEGTEEHDHEGHDHDHDGDADHDHAEGEEHAH